MALKSLFSTLIIFTLPVFIGGGFVASAAPSAINVLDYGAVGDGQKDDTQAIQRAMDAAHAEIKPGRWGERGMRYTSSPEVVFPAGRYRISGVIQVHARNVRGEGEAIILQSDKDSDIFHFPSSWQVRVRDLTFIGGKTQLDLGNDNLDRGQIVIDKCKFYHAAAAALITRKGTDSTFLTVRECVFSECRQAIISHCDWATVRDCWITSDPGMKNMAVIVNHKVMTIDNLLGVPLGRHPGVRWIDNHDRLSITGSRFGAEGGGFTPVYNFARFRGHTNGNYVIIENSNVGAWSNYLARCAVYCIEVPNMIRIEGSSLNVLPVILDSKIKPEEYFANVTSPKMLNYSVSSSIGEFIELPEMLRHPIIHPQRIEEQLSELDTALALKAVLASTSPSTTRHDNNGIIRFPSERWTLDDLMDGTSTRNSEYLAMEADEDRFILMRRTGGTRVWPHVLLKKLEIDTSKSPYFRLELAEGGQGRFQTVVKAIDHESGEMHTLYRRNRNRSHSIDLRTFGLTGKRLLSFLVYYLPDYIRHSDKEGGAWDFGEAGDYIIINHAGMSEAP